MQTLGAPDLITVALFYRKGEENHKMDLNVVVNMVESNSGE